MKANTNIAHVKKQDLEVIEVKLWSLYLLLSNVSVYNQMVESSLDHGPVEKNPQTPGRITFRFKLEDWTSNIKKLLYNYRIPVIVAPTNASLVRLQHRDLASA